MHVFQVTSILPVPPDHHIIIIVIIIVIIIIIILIIIVIIINIIIITILLGRVYTISTLSRKARGQQRKHLRR